MLNDLVWPHVAEWCADLLAGTSRPHRVAMAAFTFVSVLLATAVLLVRWGSSGGLLAATLVAALLVAGREVFVARERLWRAATLDLDDPRQQPRWHGEARIAAPTAVALSRLAGAVDAARRGHFVEATDLAAMVDRRRLRPAEACLLEAVRSMVSLGLGDLSRAAQLAVLALPTGVRDMDSCLGRALLGDAWRDDARLRAIDASWQAAGVEPGRDGPLPRLRRLVRVRIDPIELERVTALEAGALSEEAQAVGDPDLAAELSALSRRSGTYR